MNTWTWADGFAIGAKLHAVPGDSEYTTARAYCGRVTERWGGWTRIRDLDFNNNLDRDRCCARCQWLVREHPTGHAPTAGG